MFEKLPVMKPLYWLLKCLFLPVEWEVSVGAVVYRTQHGTREFLVLKYPSGHYDFPKGHQEKGETEIQTLLREVREETGLTKLHVFNQKQTIKYYYRAKGNEYRKRKRAGRGTLIFKLVHFYPAQADFGPVTLSDEHIGFKWMSYQKARRRVTFENAKRVLDMAARADSR